MRKVIFGRLAVVVLLSSGGTASALYLKHRYFHNEHHDARLIPVQSRSGFSNNDFSNNSFSNNDFSNNDFSNNDFGG